MEKLTDTSQKRKVVLSAVEQQGGSVAVADVVSVTGMPTLEVTLLLNRLAWDNGGHLQVTDKGQLIYHFSDNGSDTPLRQVLSRILAIGQIAGRHLLTFFRFFFGLLLVLSLTITNLVTVSCLTVVGAMGGMRPAPMPGFNLFSLLLSIVKSYGNKEKDFEAVTGTERFLELCFRFVFGAGDPNAEMVDYHWKLVAKRITAGNGVVCKEELLPFLINTSRPDRELLEAVVRFDGIPECSEGGRIIYRFPSLQGASNLQDESIAIMNSPGASLREGKWRFSNSSLRANIPVIGLVFGNLCFCTALNWLVQFLPWFRSLPTILWISSLLWGYATLIAVFPLCRLVLNYVRNFGVRARNAERQRLANTLISPSPELADRLKEVANARQVNQDYNVIYDTQKPYLEQSDRSWNPERGFAI